MANDASHQIDLARWLWAWIIPRRSIRAGGRFDSRGAAETPDTQIAVWEFPDLLINFELTLYTPYMLKISPDHPPVGRRCIPTGRSAPRGSRSTAARG